jgi:SMI1 / KNR4 family (SUKH-1)
MSEFSRLLSALEKHWKKRGISIYPGLDDSEIEEFEEAKGVRLPDDLREYFRHFNGCGDDEFRFIRLSELEPPSAIPMQGDVSHYDLSKREFVIVDYLQYCYWYTIDLSDPSARETPVYISGIHKNHIVAGSFSEFIQLYLDDDTALHPHALQDKS